MTTKINEAKSALLVWSLRKALINVTYLIVKMYHSAGYSEIATGICISLLEFNLFPPSDITLLTPHPVRLQRFKEYWNQI
jgi:hypothetical protein